MLDLSYYIFLSFVFTFSSALFSAFLLSSISDPLSLDWERLSELRLNLAMVSYLPIAVSYSYNDFRFLLYIYSPSFSFCLSLLYYMLKIYVYRSSLYRLFSSYLPIS